MLELDSLPQTAVVCCFGGNALVYGGSVAFYLRCLLLFITDEYSGRRLIFLQSFIVWFEHPIVEIYFRCRGEHEEASGCLRLLVIFYEEDQIISFKHALLLALFSRKVTDSPTSL